MQQFIDGRPNLGTESDSAKRFLFRSFTTGNSVEGQRLPSLCDKTASPHQPHNAGMRANWGFS